MISLKSTENGEGHTPYKKISVNIARATVEMMRTSELRNRRNIGGLLGVDRMRPIEYFILLSRPVAKSVSRVVC